MPLTVVIILVGGACGHGTAASSLPPFIPCAAQFATTLMPNNIGQGRFAALLLMHLLELGPLRSFSACFGQSLDITRKGLSLRSLAHHIAGTWNA